jgi:folate-dependent phosphoribosylglycinamide formyltransferase PurN|tara:strand:- start:5732 stop:6559 length:828 start_codon:yes stop_codon:yes gene_type:complete
MKVLLFSGTHSRHAYIHEQILKNFDVCGTVVMEREPIMPGQSVKGNKNDISFWPPDVRSLYEMHFNKRDQVEKLYYHDKSSELYDSYCDVLRVTPEELNSDLVKEFVRKKNPDVCFIFGTNIIKDNITEVMPNLSINLHLGLSPWYRGSATLFWPFYNLQPQFAGSTFHLIVNEPDAGDIIHQSTPPLHLGDSMHETAANTVIQSAKDLVKLLNLIKENKTITTSKQKHSGKNWLIKDFEPHHLKTIYRLYNDKIVDEYLNGNLGNRTPNLIKAF